MNEDQPHRSPRILVVEDNLTTSKMLVLFLNDAGFEVDCAFSGTEALNQFGEATFDLVLLDLMLPDQDGMSVCRSIRQSSDVPVVMLTAKSTEDDIVDGLEAGAADYVCKPFGSRELLARVRRCLTWQKRKLITDANDAARPPAASIELDPDRREVRVHGTQIKLTKREFAILELLASQPGRVFTRNQILNRAMGPNYDGFERSIDTHILNLRRKIGEPKGKPKLILSEPGIGYRLNDHHEE